jgi:hypothetical protein
MTIALSENAFGPVDPAVAAGRRMAASRMFDVCMIHRPGSEPDPLTGEAVAERVWGGRCEVSTFEPQESNPAAGGASMTVQRYRLKVPVGSYRPQIGDVATITRASQDPNLHGRKFRVVALLHKTSATAYRLGVEEVH